MKHARPRTTKPTARLTAGFLAVALTGSTGLLLASPALAVDPGPGVIYEANGNTLDSNGVQDATFIGVEAYAPGASGAAGDLAFDLNGTANSVEAPASVAQFGTRPFQIDLDLQVAAGNTVGYYFLSSRSVCGLQDPAEGGFDFRLSPEGTPIVEVFADGQQNILASPVPVNDGQFHDITVRRTDEGAFLTVDGVTVSNTAPATQGIVSSNAPLRVGDSPCSDVEGLGAGPSAQLDGNVDNLSLALIAPTVVTQPDSQTTDPGTPVTFTSTADDNVDQTAVQFQRSDDGGVTFTDIAGATATSYTLADPAIADHGAQFRAVFTSSGGTTVSAAALLSVVGTAPQVTEQPISQTVNEGDPATFTATAAGDPAPTVQWQISTDGGATFTNVTGATDTTFTIASTTRQMNQDQYRAVFTNDVGTTATGPALLTVQFAPTITSEPADQTVNDGQSATFTVGFDAEPAATVVWEVSRDGGATFTVVTDGDADPNTLTVVATAADDGNLYRATVSNGEGAPAVSRSAVLNVNTAPVITLQPSDQSVADDTPVTFMSESDDPLATVQYQVSTDGGVTFTDIASATTRNYSFTARLADDGNRYRAVYTNALGSTPTRAALLTVTANAPAVTAQPADQTVDSGGTASFTADATSDPAATVQWQVSTDDGATYTDVAGATGKTLTVADVTAADSGNLYRAVFTNTAGAATTRSALLTVNAATPVVTDQPDNTTVQEGQDATFAAAATGDPNPSAQWQVSTDGGVTFADIAGATSDTYTVTMATNDQNGHQYRVVFTNTAGSVTSSAAVLTVTPLPVVAPSAPLNVTATQTGPGEVTITWEAPANDGTSPVTSYDVGYGNGGSGNGESVPATARSIVFTGLSVGEYTAVVTAVSAAGAGERATVPFTITAETAPVEPVAPAEPVPPTDAGPTQAGPGGRLPETGAETATVAAATLGLLALGSVLTATARRRSRTQAL